MFLAAFLSYSVLFYLNKFNLTFIKKSCVRQKRLFFSNEINFCRHEIRFFYVKLILRTRVSQNAFNYNQREYWIYSIFQYDTLLLKNSVQRSAGNKVYLIFLILVKKLFNVHICRVCLILFPLLLLLNVIAFAIS